MPHRPDADTADDLLTPSFADRAPAVAAGPRPWRLGSQGWVAFFGGLLAVSTIAILNARRLGMKAGAIALIALAGLAGLVVELTLLTSMAGGEGRDLRMAARVVALGAWGAMYLVQRAADRRYHHFRAGHDEEYASLWGPGVLVSVALGFVELCFVLAALGEI